MGSQLGGWPDGKNATQISRNSEVDRGSTRLRLVGAADEQFDRAAVIVVARLLKNPRWPDA